MKYIIRKICYNGIDIRVKFDEYKEGRLEECDITYSEPPSVDFIKAYERLPLIANQILKLKIDPELIKNNFYVRCIGVDFKYSNSGAISAKLICKYYVEQAGKNTPVNTPLLMFAEDEEGYGRQGFFTKAQQSALELVKDEAQAYIQGERAQMTLLEAVEVQTDNQMKEVIDAVKNKNNPAITPIN